MGGTKYKHFYGNQSDWGIPQQAIFEDGSGMGHRKNSKPLLVYTACQFVKCV